MPFEIEGEAYYWIQEVCHKTNVSRCTLLRWLKQGVIDEPYRDRRGWRVFDEEDLKKITTEVGRIHRTNKARP